MKGPSKKLTTVEVDRDLPRFKCTSFQNKRHSESNLIQNYTLEKAEHVFTKHLEGDKDGGAIAAATFLGRRKKTEIKTRTGIVLDVEQQRQAPKNEGGVVSLGPKPPLPSELKTRLEELGYYAICYTTYSHSPADIRYRVLFPLDEEVQFPDPNEDRGDYNRQYGIDKLIVKKVAAELGLSDCIDLTKLGAEAIFFTPRVSKENMEFAETFVSRGNPIDYDKYVHEATEQYKSSAEEINERTLKAANSDLEKGSGEEHNTTFDALRAKLGSLKEILLKYGYCFDQRSGRFFPHDGDPENAGIIINQCEDGVERIYCHHSNDILSAQKQLFGRKAHDSIDVEIAMRWGESASFPEGFKKLLAEHGISKSNFQGKVTNASGGSCNDNIKEPIDIFSSFTTTPFPMEALNDDERAYVTNTAASLGVDTGAVAIAMLANASAAVDARTRVMFRENSNFSGGKNMWFALVGPPATKKSPILAKTRSPIQKLQNEENSKFKKELDRFKAKSMQEKKDEEPPTCRLYMVQDSTIEALAQHLSKQERGTTIHVDELETVFNSMDRYKKGSNDKAHYLTGYDGGPANILRVSSGMTAVSNFSFGVIGGIQPDVIAKHRTTNDGLLQRFIYVNLETGRLSQDIDTRKTDKAFEKNICNIAGRRAALLTLPIGSKAIITEIEEVGLMLADGGGIAGADFAGWAMKALSHFSRILIPLHALRSPSEAISHQTVVAARTIFFDYVVPHAIQFFSTENSTLFRREQAAANYILSKKLERLVPSDLTANVREFRNDPNNRSAVEIVGPVAENLVNHGWLERASSNGASKSWRVNPRVHEVFEARAEAERQRRDICHKQLRSLGRAKGDS